MFEDGEQLAKCSLNPSKGNNLSMDTRREAPDAHDSRPQSPKRRFLRRAPRTSAAERTSDSGALRSMKASMSTSRERTSRSQTSRLSAARFHYAPLPNCRFNADANTGHGFAIFMASVGALRASRSGAG